jgi:hypothetical protein
LVQYGGAEENDIRVEYCMLQGTIKPDVVKNLRRIIEEDGCLDNGWADKALWEEKLMEAGGKFIEELDDEEAPRKVEGAGSGSGSSSSDDGAGPHHKKIKIEKPAVVQEEDK